MQCDRLALIQQQFDLTALDGHSFFVLVLRIRSSPSLRLALPIGGQKSLSCCDKGGHYITRAAELLISLSSRSRTLNRLHSRRRPIPTPISLQISGMKTLFFFLFLFLQLSLSNALPKGGGGRSSSGTKGSSGTKSKGSKSSSSESSSR